MQKQLLTVAVLRNQALMDGAVQGQTELELLGGSGSKRAIKCEPVTVPGAALKLDAVLSRAADGVALLQRKNEDTRLSSALTKEAGEHVYSVAARKGRYRGAALKKYNALLSRVVSCQSHKSAESRLRILRAYRLRLLHEYCQLVLHEAYQDSITIQTLMACSELRWKSQLFPEDTSPFTAGIGNCPEHFPLALSEAAKGFQKVGPIGPDGEPRPTLDDLISGRPKTVFYIPASCELVEAVRTAAADLEKTNPPKGEFPPANTCAAPVAPEQIDPDAVDASVKAII